MMLSFWKRHYTEKIFIDIFPDRQRRCPVNKHIPHGIKYSLTLHDRYNQRIIGYDNAHGIKLPKKKKFSGRRDVWDHKHKKTCTTFYEFESAYQLLEDFWSDVNAVLKSGGV